MRCWLWNMEGLAPGENAGRPALIPAVAAGTGPGGCVMGYSRSRNMYRSCCSISAARATSCATLSETSMLRPDVGRSRGEVDHQGGRRFGRDILLVGEGVREPVLDAGFAAGQS